MTAAKTRTCVIAMASAVLAAGCAGSGDGASDQAALKLPTLPSLEQVAAIGSGSDDRPVGSATELYARVARGANTCWFGGKGPLKKDYIYHAEADAASRGGKAEITVHARDPAQPNPRGPKAYRINIDPNGETATVTTENLKMPDNVALAMTSDVNRWSKGDQGCAGASTAIAAGWAPAPAAAATLAKPTVANKKTKTKPKVAAAKIPVEAPAVTPAPQPSAATQ